MLSDEEKYAIDYLKIYIERDVMYENRHYKQIETILNLIEKQQKEIEELKEDNKHQWEERCKLTFELENSTSNDKIKAKIEELDLAVFKNQTIYTVNKMQEIKFARLCLAELLEKEGE